VQYAPAPSLQPGTYAYVTPHAHQVRAAAAAAALASVFVGNSSTDEVQGSPGGWGGLRRGYCPVVRGCVGAWGRVCGMHVRARGRGA
jgi:rhodanese-related sulfurtransferase